ncbi:MAG: hydroxymethylbilane synthase [Kiritimatiellae bacterium]|nr:hydroxymethylbilane synthase [Kiritimatiellia bacterium]
MVPEKLKIATRESQLALKQADEALQKLKNVFPTTTAFQIIKYTAPGDRDKKTDLTNSIIPDDYFTHDIDQALITHQADLAVHSAKDLPKKMRDELTVAAYLPAKDIRDALVFPKKWDETNKPKMIGTSSPHRMDQIQKLYPDIELKPIRGNIKERLEQVDHGDYDAIVIAACALERLGLSSRIKGYLPYEPILQQGRLAIVAHKEAQELIDLIKKLDIRNTAGLVALVGSPADPSLLSKRAEQYIQQADVVFHDRLISDKILLAIHDKAISVGKAGGHRAIPQADIHRMMLIEAEKGSLVVRLHGGDPCIYGHLSEELEFLAAWNIRTDIVPTPTAAQIASAHASAPLTHRGDGGHMTFIPGSSAKESIPIDLPGPTSGNLAIYMGVQSIGNIQTGLKNVGWLNPTPIVIGQRLGYKDETIIHTTLSQVTEFTVEAPAVFLIGTRHFPAHGWTLFVGTDPEHFLKYGPLLHWPLISLVSRPLKERIEHIEKLFDHCDGIVFPSRHAVQSFIEALFAWKDTRVLANKKLLAVGPATAKELEKFGLKADKAADTYGGVQALAEEIDDTFKGTYLYPCSDAAPQKQRTEHLKEHGIQLLPAIFYTNRKMPYQTFPRLPIDRVLFTSTTAVKYYFELYPDEQQTKRTWLAVGPSTLKAIQKLNLSGEII